MFEEEDNAYFEGNLNEDLRRFEAFLKGDEMGFLDSDRWEALIDHYLVAGSYKKALTCCEEALSQFSFNTLFKLRRAQAYSALGRLKESISLLSEIERDGLPSFELLLTKASVFSQLKDHLNAIKYFKNALVKAEPEDKDEVFLDLAMEYESAGKWDEALAVLRQAIEANPKNEGAIYEIAYCYDHLGKYEESIQCYKDFIDENPYSFTAWYNLGNAYLKMDRYEKAIWAYDYCTIINDEFGPVYFNLGNAFLSIDKYRKAIECFSKSIDLDGDDPMGFCYLGECHEQLGELDLARHFYRRSLELAPLLPEAWLGLGIVEDLEGKTKEGIVLIHKALELDPENAGIHHVLAGAYEKIQEVERASESYEMSLSLDPSDEECLTNYVQLLTDHYSISEAWEYLKTFELIHPQNQVIALLKVNMSWLMGNQKYALELYQECLFKNREKALELFEINPALKSVQEFVLLSD